MIIGKTPRTEAIDSRLSTCDRQYEMHEKVRAYRSHAIQLESENDKLVEALRQVATAASVHSTRSHIIEIAQMALLEVNA